MQEDNKKKQKTFQNPASPKINSLNNDNSVLIVGCVEKPIEIYPVDGRDDGKIVVPVVGVSEKTNLPWRVNITFRNARSGMTLSAMISKYQFNPGDPVIVTAKYVNRSIYISDRQIPVTELVATRARNMRRSEVLEYMDKREKVSILGRDNVYVLPPNMSQNEANFTAFLSYQFTIVKDYDSNSNLPPLYYCMVNIVSPEWMGIDARPDDVEGKSDYRAAFNLETNRCYVMAMRDVFATCPIDAPGKTLVQIKGEVYSKKLKPEMTVPGLSKHATNMRAHRIDALNFPKEYNGGYDLVELSDSDLSKPEENY